MGGNTERARVYIAAMGGTGTGKTSFINLVGQSKFLVGDGLESCTDRIQQHHFICEGQDVVLIDIPGFDDSNKSDTEIVKMIADFLAAEYHAKRYLSGIMYFHRITDVRMGGASRRNFTMFQKLCGEEASSNMAIVTTRWDLEEEAVAKARFEEMKTKPQLCLPIIENGGSMFQHNNTLASAHEIVHHIIANTSPKSLLIQREMAGGMKLSETTAGRELEQEILKQVEKNQREVAEIIEEMEQIQDSTELEALEADVRALRERAAHWQGEAAKLSEPSLLPDPPATNTPLPDATQVGALNTSIPNLPSRVPPDSLASSSLATSVSSAETTRFATVDDLAQIKKDLQQMQYRQDRIEEEKEQFSASVKHILGLMGILDRMLAIFHSLRTHR